MVARKRAELSNPPKHFVVLYKGRKVWGPHTPYACMNWYHTKDPRPMHDQSDFSIVQRPLLSAPVHLPIRDETVLTTASRMSQMNPLYGEMEYMNKCFRNPENNEQKSMASRFAGVMAELQVCEARHGVFSESYKRVTGDKGWDMEIHDLKVDVKTSFWYQDSWSIKKEKYESDILLFTNVEIVPTRRVILRGFLPPSELVYCDRIKDMWRVTSSKIRPLRDLAI